MKRRPKEKERRRLGKGFLQIRVSLLDAILTAPVRDSTQLLVLAVFAMGHSGPRDDYVRPTWTELQKVLGFSRPTIGNALREAFQTGMLVKVDGGFWDVETKPERWRASSTKSYRSRCRTSSAPKPQRLGNQTACGSAPKPQAVRQTDRPHLPNTATEPSNGANPQPLAREKLRDVATEIRKKESGGASPQSHRQERPSAAASDESSTLTERTQEALTTYRTTFVRVHGFEPAITRSDLRLLRKRVGQHPDNFVEAVVQDAAESSDDFLTGGLSAVLCATNFNRLAAKVMDRFRQRSARV